MDQRTDILGGILIKKKIFFTFVIGLLIILLIRLTGSFEEFIIQEYESKAKETTLNRLEIWKYNYDEYSLKYKKTNGSDIDKINKILAEFKKLKLFRCKARLQTKNLKYRINIENSSTREGLRVFVYDNNYIEAGIHTYTKKEKLGPFTITSMEGKGGTYKILNGDGLINTLDEIYNSLSNEE
jgi:hypothetical protein